MYRSSAPTPHHNPCPFVSICMCLTTPASLQVECDKEAKHT